MNYYAFNIGDYASATRHLTWEEDAAYRRLLDAYYQNEGPLPLDRRSIYRLVVAATAEHRLAVDTVLSEFFKETPEGWQHARCDEEIAAATDKRLKASSSAGKRWRHAKAMPTHGPPDANASKTGCIGNAPNPNPNPNPNQDISLPQASSSATEPRAREAEPSDAGGLAAREAFGEGEVREALYEASGWLRHKGLDEIAPIMDLLNRGADLALDVLPVIAAKSENVQHPTSWAYFVKPISEAVARRRQSVDAMAVAVPQTCTTVKRGTPQFEAWVKFKKGQGLKTAFFERQDVATVPSEWPPSDALLANMGMTRKVDAA